MAPPGGRGPPPGGRPRRLHYRSLSNGLIVALVVSAPPLLIEANWHGTPLYRTTQGQVALGVAALGFLAGGAVAGRHRRRVEGALLQGLAVAVLAETCLLVAAVFRLAVLHRGLPHPSTVGWTVLGAVLLAGLACAGGLAGRAAYLRSRRKRRA